MIEELNQSVFRSQN